jgi:hypothetical protein
VENHIVMLVWGVFCAGLAFPIGYAYGVISERRKWDALIDGLDASFDFVVRPKPGIHLGDR